MKMQTLVVLEHSGLVLQDLSKLKLRGFLDQLSLKMKIKESN